MSQRPNSRLSISSSASSSRMQSSPISPIVDRLRGVFNFSSANSSSSSNKKSRRQSMPAMPIGNSTSTTSATFSRASTLVNNRFSQDAEPLFPSPTTKSHTPRAVNFIPHLSIPSHCPPLDTSSSDAEAEELDDDNLAWGSPTSSSARSPLSGTRSFRFF